MWVAKFKFFSDNYGEIAKKLGLFAYAYPLTRYVVGNKGYYIGTGTVFGSEDMKKQFIELLKKQPNIKRFEVRNDFIMILREEENTKEFDVMYNPRLIHVRPIIIDKNGYETWHVASWERWPLNDLLDVVEQKKNFELLKMRTDKISNVFTTSFISNLTLNQKRALDLAIEYNYYAYPRYVELKDLARKMNVSLSTYREHLRKAEHKVIPQLVRNHNIFE